MAWISTAETVNPFDEGPAPVLSIGYHPVLGRDQKDSIVHFVLEDAIHGLNEKGRDFHVYGRIEYQDIFERDHWLTFCYTPTNYTASVD